MKQNNDRNASVNRNIPRPLPFGKNCLGWGLFMVAIAWSLQQAGLFDRDLINEKGWGLVLQFLQASLHPDVSGEFLQIVVKATLTTLSFAVCGTALSLAIGTVGGIFASKMWWRSLHLEVTTEPSKVRIGWLALRWGLALPRSIHEAIWGLFFLNIFGLDPLVAILAIAIPFGTITAKVFSDILDETPREPLNALLTAGVPPFTAFLYSLIPQAFTNLLSYAFYRFECSIRAAAVLGIIGAGGLGYEIFLSLQSLRYEQMWTLFWALVLLNGSIDLWSAALRHRLGAPNRLDLNQLKVGNKLSREIPPTPLFKGGLRKQIAPTSLLRRHPVRWRIAPVWCRALARSPSIPPTQSAIATFLNADRLILFSCLSAIAIVPLSFAYLQPDFTKLWAPRTARLLTDIIAASFPPDFTDLPQYFELSLQTLAMSVLAIAIAGLGGILLSFPAAYQTDNCITKFNKNNFLKAKNKIIVVAFMRILLLILRAIPAPIWALILLFGFFPGILPGAIALGIYNLGILGRLMAEVIENLDNRPQASLWALGATDSQVFLYAILPRTLPGFLAYILYRWEVCIRETAIVGLVGAGGLGRLLMEQLSSFDYAGIVTTLICFIGLTVFVDRISSVIR